MIGTVADLQWSVIYLLRTAMKVPLISKKVSWEKHTKKQIFSNFTLIIYVMHKVKDNNRGKRLWYCKQFPNLFSKSYHYTHWSCITWKFTLACHWTPFPQWSCETQMLPITDQEISSLLKLRNKIAASNIGQKLSFQCCS